MVLSHGDVVEEPEQAAEGQPGQVDKVCLAQKCKHHHCFISSLPSSVKGMRLLFKSHLLLEDSVNFF